MKRPAIKDAKVKKYVEDLEKQLSNFSSERTIVKLYLGVKKQLDDMAEFLMNDIEVIDEDSGEVKVVKIMDIHTLSSKNDKFMDRYLKILEKFSFFTKQLKEVEKEINPETLEKVEKAFVKNSGVSPEELLKEMNG